MEKNKKINLGLLSVMVLLVIGIFGTVGYLFYTKLQDTEKQEKRENIDVGEVVEKKVTDRTVLEGLEKKVKTLENIKISNIADEQDKYMSGYIYKRDFSNNELSYEIKLFHVLENLYIEKMDNSPVTTDYDLSIFGNGNEDFVVQIDVSLVEDFYYDLYGNKQINHRDFKELWNCPMAIYDEKNQKYYLAASCGGTSNVSLTTYIDKYTEDDDYFHVYIRLGAIEGAEDGSSITAYTDFARKKKYRELTEEELIHGIDIITEDNYKDFSEYKYTFSKKQDGTYYFDSIMKIVQ